MRALVLVVVAGCWTAPAPAPVVTPPPPDPVTTAAPRVTWLPLQGGAIDSDGLPAVARDGSLVVYAMQGNDGARGFPNLKLVARSRDDKVVDELVVIDPNRYEWMSAAEIESRFQKGNAWLAARHAAHPLAPLHEDTTGATAWESNHLRVTVDGRVRVQRDTPASWLSASHPLFTESPDTCENPAKLAHAWLAAESTLAVVEIAYAGTDTCWEPPPQTHVVAW